MDKGIAGRPLAIPAREAAMVCESVSELEEHSSRILSGVGGLDAMVELDFYLAPPAWQCSARRSIKALSYCSAG